MNGDISKNYWIWIGAIFLLIIIITQTNKIDLPEEQILVYASVPSIAPFDRDAFYKNSNNCVYSYCDSTASGWCRQHYGRWFNENCVDDYESRYYDSIKQDECMKFYGIGYNKADGVCKGSVGEGSDTCPKSYCDGNNYYTFGELQTNPRRCEISVSFNDKNCVECISLSDCIPKYTTQSYNSYCINGTEYYDKTNYNCINYTCSSTITNELIGYCDENNDTIYQPTDEGITDFSFEEPIKMEKSKKINPIYILLGIAVLILIIIMKNQ